MKALASAKINLHLDVIRRREDGYHEIETFYQPISLWDELTIERVPSGITVEGDDATIPWNEENLCYRAAKLILDKTGRREGVRIRVAKGIPSGAGLGGGSSDAAATLLGINKLFECGVSEGELRELAALIGSDVPFFVLGKPAIGRGRGEVLEETRGLPGGWVVVVKPDVTISTRWAYENLNLILTKGLGGAKLTTLVEALQGFPNTRLEAYNSFEAAVVDHFPSVYGILSVLRSGKALLSSLSGSGSACFAIFAKESEAREMGGRLGEKGLFVRVAQPVETTVRFV
ncbi:MAG: 4-(cytidine 5'-diphospho)-2-C-methyl-D-erythritol kinase [Candidatus Krumholzibacteria bacterium]|nr:4-(cytidine 5'-diphospho)-2-C-methyl-D-erythritol kinase [Candidatus Krumholzibacteria bacterium]